MGKKCDRAFCKKGLLQPEKKEYLTIRFEPTQTRVAMLALFLPVRLSGAFSIIARCQGRLCAAQAGR